VLIEAEAGCRPAEIASALHAANGATSPLIVVDCSSDDPEAIEERLFGRALRTTPVHALEAVGERCALVDARSGTLFLDHVDELPASAQRRLARVLRDGEVRVGRRTVRTAFRLVAATTRDLQDETREGRFREDLLRRLTKNRITVAPLRRRPADIPEILTLLRASACDGGVQAPGFSPQAAAVLASMPWTRNFDELTEFIDRLCRAGVQQLSAEQLLEHVTVRRHLGRMDLTASLREARRQFERDYIAAVLERHRWSMSEAARTLGIERANLYRKTRQLGITRGSRETWTMPS
jgi:two-component system response regulator HydG